MNQEANAFACELLPPSHLVKKYIKQGLNVKQMSEKFQVPEEAMRERLRWNGAEHLLEGDNYET